MYKSPISNLTGNLCMQYEHKDDIVHLNLHLLQDIPLAVLHTRGQAALWRFRQGNLS
jgi:hypothetical protein